MQILHKLLERPIVRRLSLLLTLSLALGLPALHLDLLPLVLAGELTHQLSPILPSSASK